MVLSKRGILEDPTTRGVSRPRNTVFFLQFSSLKSPRGTVSPLRLAQRFISGTYVKEWSYGLIVVPVVSLQGTLESVVSFTQNQAKGGTVVPFVKE